MMYAYSLQLPLSVKSDLIIKDTVMTRLSLCEFKGTDLKRCTFIFLESVHVIRLTLVSLAIRVLVFTLRSVNMRPM